MDRRDAFEKSWAARHRVSIDEIREHRFETEDGYDLPLLGTNYRTWCAAIESVVVELPEERIARGYGEQVADALGFNDGLSYSRTAIEAAGIKVAP